MQSRRSPVLVGVGQLDHHVQSAEEGREPLEMMMDAVRLAAEDAGKSELLEAADSVYVIKGAWLYHDPARAIAERIGAPGAETVGTPFGGNMVQSAVNDAAMAIQRGDIDIALLTGAEQGRTQALARKQGTKLTFSPAPGTPDRVIGGLDKMVHDAERERGIMQPIQFYPVFENAIRYARGESLEDHIVRISELWARFNAVAVDNPHAWIRDPISAEEIRTPSPRNRMIGFPYPKLMNSNNGVDQAAALILCSLETAERLGVDSDRLVFPHAGTDAHDHNLVSNRDDLHSSPAIRIAGRRALELAEISPHDVDHVDIYSCFPSAVQVSAMELGLSEKRRLTVTGGMTFGGGALNNYVMHSIATMAEILRADPGSRGLITANGGNLSKHAFGVYSTTPPDHPFLHDCPQEQVDREPRREVVMQHDGPATIESYTVMFDADQPSIALVACLLDDGRRAWANSTDRALAEAMTREEFCGRAAKIDAAGVLHVH